MYTFHGDTTYGWTTLINSPGYPTNSGYNENWQAFQPTFLGNWKSTPPVSYSWTPNESQDTWNSALWDIADGGHTETDDIDALGNDEDDWSPSPKPTSGTMQYTATDSDNATFTGEYDMNIHPMVEPIGSDKEHILDGTRLAFDQNTQHWFGVIQGPAPAQGGESIGETNTCGYTVQVSTSIGLEELAQCFGDIFPGTVAGNIGYSNTTGQTTTWNIPASPAVPAGSIAICEEEAQFMRHVLDYRSFSPAGEDIIYDSNHTPVAYRSVSDDGPFDDPRYFWKIVNANAFTLPSAGPVAYAYPSVANDPNMPPPVNYDPHQP